MAEWKVAANVVALCPDLAREAAVKEAGGGEAGEVEMISRSPDEPRKSLYRVWVTGQY
ncbi:hypothetical protein GWI34_18415 [Actinomadura sp. DSM 109109]|nr:hypothetical protein [Actinomadura lepetitiana]